MKKIQKSEPPVEFSQYIKRYKPRNWGELPAEIKSKCLKALFSEQYDISAYTEAPLNINNVHIDHFRKRDLFPKLTFCWENLFADLSDERYGAKKKDSSSLHKEDYEKLINPATEQAECLFEYMFDGSIIPRLDLSEKDRERAQFTIDVFNLQDASLKSRRATLISMIKDMLIQPDKQILSSIKFYGFPSVAEFAIRFFRQYRDSNLHL